MIFRFGVIFVIAICVSHASALPPCTCTREARPVCGSDGETYGNECMLQCERERKPDLTVIRPGACNEEPLCFCTLEYNPICGTNGVTYSNDCSFKCETQKVAIAHRGACIVKREEPGYPACACTRIKRPVCGTDGKTYGNPCMLNCAREQNEDLHVDYEGPCVSEIKRELPPCVCTRNRAPVCASDGLEYSNECMMRCASADLTVVKRGPC